MRPVAVQHFGHRRAARDELVRDRRALGGAHGPPDPVEREGHAAPVGVLRVAAGGRAPAPRSQGARRPLGRGIVAGQEEPHRVVQNVPAADLLALGPELGPLARGAQRRHIRAAEAADDQPRVTGEHIDVDGFERTGRAGGAAGAGNTGGGRDRHPARARRRPASPALPGRARRGGAGDDLGPRHPRHRRHVDRSQPEGAGHGADLQT